VQPKKSVQTWTSQKFFKNFLGGVFFPPPPKFFFFFEKLLAGYWEEQATGWSPRRRRNLCWLGGRSDDLLWWGFGFSTDHLRGMCIIKVAYSDQNLHRAKTNDFASKAAVPQNWSETYIPLKITRIRLNLDNSRLSIVIEKNSANFCLFLKIRFLGQSRLFRHPNWISKRLGRRKRHCWIKSWPIFYVRWLTGSIISISHEDGTHFNQNKKNFQQSWKTANHCKNQKCELVSMGNKNRIVASSCRWNCEMELTWFKGFSGFQKKLPNSVEFLFFWENLPLFLDEMEYRTTQKMEPVTVANEQRK